MSDYGEPEIDVSEMITLPADWDEEAIPFGDRAEEDPDRTVGAWVERGAAPAYAACRDMFRKQKGARGREEGGRAAMNEMSDAPHELRDCGDCGAKPGELHQPGCDVERCVLCGGQAISCGCVYEVNDMEESDLEEENPTIYKYGPNEAMLAVLEKEEEKYGGRLPWTGEYPGRSECREFGWYSKWVEGKGWVRCDKDDPGAGPDLNRLTVGGRAKWSHDKRRWVLR